MDASPTATIAIAATFFVAGMVKGITGMGLPTIAMGVLGLFMPPIAAASLLVIPSFVTNFWQLVAGPNLAALISRLWPMMFGIAIGTVAGSRLLISGSTKGTTVGLGAALAAYAVLGLLLRPVAVPNRVERRLSPFIGLATGLITGGTGVLVIPAVPYLQALGLAKDDLVQALGLSFTVSTMALAIGLASGGAFQGGSIVASALSVVPAVGGMWLGTAIRGGISVASFRRWFLICLALLGLELIVRALIR